MIMKKIIKKAQRNPRRIVFPESRDPRILKAVQIIAQKKIAKPLLLVKGKKSLKGITCVDMTDKTLQDRYARLMYKKRKHKGWSLGKCKKLISQENYFGTMMVVAGDADGLISGAVHTTAETLRPALQLIKKTSKVVSSVFLMQIKKKNYLFADCAVNISPNARELAAIAYSSSQTAKIFGIPARVALLSFSTLGSAHHPDVDKVRKAVKIIKRKFPRLLVEGELQVDAAIVPLIAKMKAPKSRLKGQATVLIFPDLNSGNIGYKLVQRLGGGKAIGPLIQGLAQPINDLSRGCSVQDIVNLAALTGVSVP